MDRKKSPKKLRNIDYAAKESQSWLSRKMIVVRKSKIASLKNLIILAFIAGAILAIFWVVKTNNQTNSEASSKNSKEDAKSAEIKKVNEAIKKQGANWIAEENEISKLSTEEKKKLVGVNRISESGKNITKIKYSASTKLPATLDWRNKDGKNYISPVKNQKQCGSCWAFSATAGLESQVMLSNGGKPVDLSEQVLISCGRSGTCDGGDTTGAADFFKNDGLPVESCYPYTAKVGSCDKACANWKDNTYKISDYHTVINASIDEFKFALDKYGPLVSMIYVYDDFFTYWGGVYTYVSGDPVGPHGILVVGYDDVNKYFIAKNSWGIFWGEGGFFKVPYSEYGRNTKLMFGAEFVYYDKIVYSDCFIDSFTVQKNPVASGIGTFLNWTTSGVSGSCKLTGGIYTGVFDKLANYPNGILVPTLGLGSNTTYTLTCKNEAGKECKKSVMVNVSAK